MNDKNMPASDIQQNEQQEKTVSQKTAHYLQYYTEATEEMLKSRIKKYDEIANDYYDLVTDFYEYGWGPSFHFAYPLSNESYHDAIIRLEHYLALRLEIKKTDRILDVGCGIGGPLRNIARFTGATLVGLNNNLYQIKKGEKYNQRLGLNANCSFVKANFMDPLPFDDNSFDGVYTLEALCYAPNQAKVYAEIYRILKPGSKLVGTDWCVTPKYDANNLKHLQLKEGIAIGDGLSDIKSTSHVLESIKQAGFEVIEGRDLAEETATPWYGPLAPNISLSGFRRSAAGRLITTQIIRTLEAIHFVPKGSTLVTQFLNEGANSLVNAGKHGIFTPGFFFVAKK